MCEMHQWIGKVCFPCVMWISQFFHPKKANKFSEKSFCTEFVQFYIPQRHLDTMVSYWDNILFVIWVYIPLELQWKCCISMRL